MFDRSQNSMNVVLIEVLTEADGVAGLFTRGNVLEPYSLGCLSAVAEQHGYKTHMLRWSNQRIDQIISESLEKQPFCIGISVLTHTANRARVFAQSIKERYADIVIVVGGQHPSLDPSYVLHDCFDFAVIGEGESTFPELLDHVSGKTDINREEIFGISYASPNATDIVQTPHRPRISDLDNLPFPKRDAGFLRQAKALNLTYPSPNQQTGVAQVSYSRGCRYHCSFCVSPIVWSQAHGNLKPDSSVIYRSPKAVAREVRMLQENYGVNFLYFTDLTFNDDRNKVRDLCHAFIDEGLHEGAEMDPNHLRSSVHWFALVKVGLDHETARLMARAGCSKIGMGVESFDTSLVSTYKKPYHGIQILEDSFMATDDVGIINRCLLVLGSPNETAISIEHTIQGLRRFPVDQVRVGFLTPYPNTPIFHELKSGLITHDFDLFDEEHPVIKCDQLKPRDLVDARARIAAEFYGSTEYRMQCESKIARFPWLSESYSWYFSDLYEKSKGSLDLIAVITTKPNLEEHFT